MSCARRTILATAALGFLAVPATGQEQDNMVFHFSQLEVDASRVDETALSRWDGSGWIGTDFDRVWWSTEGEGLGSDLGSAEAMVLYGHYVRRFWDLVVGYRQDIEPAAQGYLAFGVTGLAPYWFEVGAFAFVSQEGRPSVRLEADTDLFLTQRAVLTLGGEMDLLITDDERLGLGSGISDLELGLRTRYEIRRKFAPYIDLLWVREQEALFGGTPVTESAVRIGAGVRLIY
ncbi:MAG: copper resistance protein B [Gemmatimonadota bacterium]|nr:copper resistance protein B [Gemmatimonadota bacterium]MDE3005553.1 copper resistance protein B [Gemmatimonadota bacterium]MDE3013880.1 copper resistance protein B [Gemmatimonadota bacterium]